MADQVYGDFRLLADNPRSNLGNAGIAYWFYPDLAMTRQNLTDLTYFAVQRGAKPDAGVPD